METCPASGNAPSVYLIEEATGSSPVAPIINQGDHPTVGRCKHPFPTSATTPAPTMFPRLLMEAVLLCFCASVLLPDLTISNSRTTLERKGFRGHPVLCRLDLTDKSSLSLAYIWMDRRGHYG